MGRTSFGRWPRLLVCLTVATFAVAWGLPAAAGAVTNTVSCAQFDGLASHPEIAECSLTISGQQGDGTLTATATFTIASGYTDVEVGLASYRKPPPRFAVTYPQELYDSDSGLFSEGGPYTLTVSLPTPCGFYQVDLFTGAVIGPTIPDADAGYVAEGRRLAAATGGFECPLTLGFWKNHASCPTSDGNQDPVLDQTIAAANGGTGIRVGNLLLTTADPNYCIKAVRILDKRNITGADKSTTPAFQLAAQLLAAKLNLASLKTSCPKVNDAVVAGQNLLSTVNFTGTGTPPMTKAQKTLALQLALLLDTYNNGYTTLDGTKLLACV